MKKSRLVSNYKEVHSEVSTLNITYLSRKEINAIKEYCEELGYEFSLTRIPRIKANGRNGFIQRKNNGDLIFFTNSVIFDSKTMTHVGNLEVEENLTENIKTFKFAKNLGKEITTKIRVIFSIFYLDYGVNMLQNAK